MFCYFFHFQKLPEVNNHPIGENSPNLVTLPYIYVCMYVCMYVCTGDNLAGSHSQNSFNESHSFIESLKILDLKTCPA
jgi:hypothetical protein